MRSKRLPLPAITVVAGLLAILTSCVMLLSWDPRPRTDQSFDRRTNGLWLGHRWFTGVGVRSNEPVSSDDLEQLLATFDRRGVRYAFVHVGPVLADGRLADTRGPILADLMRRAPDVVLLAWLGARVEKISMTDPEFRRGLLETIASLRDAGFEGVHFDFEPLRDDHPGYLDILDAVRETFGPGFTISQATPRAGPYGFSIGPLEGSFWSEAFYRETMARSDQTVVMAYDTGLDFTKGYVAFVRHQTEILGPWACQTPGHELLIGVPSYEDVPTYSDPQVENLRTASLGVRAALERIHPPPPCVIGLAIYANWVTDDAEWRDFEKHWISPGEAPDAEP